MDREKVEQLKGMEITLSTECHSKLKRLTPAKRAERDHIIREQWVKAMELRIVQEQLSKCHKSEGVNHYENCKDWSERYLNLLEDSKVRRLFVLTIYDLTLNMHITD